LNACENKPDEDIGLHRLAFERVTASIGGMAESGETCAWPQRLHHELPGWIKSGAIFHVRLRVDARQPTPLVDEQLGPKLLAAAQNYHRRDEWHCLLFLLMPDHIHALLAFPPEKSMSSVVGGWKR
jgi:putative transposase